MAKAYILSQKDLDILKDVVQSVRNRRVNMTNRYGPYSDNGPSTDIYVALTPDEGISRLETVFNGPGENHGDGDKPGYADCTIVQLVETSGEFSLETIEGKTERIYNLSDAKIPGNIWILVAKDKYGRWYVTENTHTNMRWVRVTDTTISTYGYLGILLEYDSSNLTFEDEQEGTAGPVQVWLNFATDYEPTQTDVDEQIPFLSRQEENAPDGDQVYVATVGIVGTGTSSQVRWVRIIDKSLQPYGYRGMLMDYDPATRTFSDSSSGTSTGSAGTADDGVIWVYFNDSNFVPSQEDIDNETIFIARKEETAGDGSPVYVAEVDVTTPEECCVRWVRLQSTTVGLYGYIGILQDFDTASASFSDSYAGTGSTLEEVWLNFSDDNYVPTQDDVDNETKYIATQEDNAPDDELSYLALAPEETGSTVRWIRIISLFAGLYGYAARLLDYNSTTGLFSDADENPIYVQFANEYRPTEHDLTIPTRWLARKEDNAPDEVHVYTAVTDITTRWVKLTTTTIGAYGYPGELMLADVDTGLFVQTGTFVWVQFSSIGYRPFVSDILMPNIWLARQEQNAGDGQPLYRIYNPPEDTRWLRLIEASTGQYGYMAYAQQHRPGSNANGIFIDDLVALTTVSQGPIGMVWLRFVDGYTPRQSDIDDKVKYLGRRELNAPDGIPIYMALGGETVEMVCEGSSAQFVWYAGRLIHTDADEA